ncbi:MAG: leucine-rich repeat domain-containing protein [Sphingobacteriales bacterium]|nr:leucine-rich repeat domain-containing protein [Sphingobacteriales bacterium]
MQGQNLSTLPEIVCQQTQLKVLMLNGTKLTTLPESISKLTNLQTLDLRDNPALAPYDKELSGEELKTFLQDLSKGEIKFGK